MGARSRTPIVTLVALVFVLGACDNGEAASPSVEASEPAESQDPAASATAGEEIACDEPTTLSYATSLGTDSAYYAGAVALQEATEELSDGCLLIEIFPDAQLGTDADMIEGMQLGSLDMASPSTGAMGAVVPEAAVLDLPYLFDSYEHAYCVLDGPIGSEDIHAMFDGVGFHPLGYWEIGFRHLTNSLRPVSTPSDVEGMRLRTLPSIVHQEAWILVGAQPTVMDFTEVYNGLDTGVVDGQENPYNIIITGNLYEVQPYLSATGHAYQTAPTSIADATWEELSPELQGVLMEAVATSTDAQREASSGDEAGQIEFLEEAGVEINLEPDRDAFREAMAPTWDGYVSEHGNQDLIDKIREAADSC